MKKQDQRVVGSYGDEKETKRVIRHLLDQGFNRNQLTIYTNESKHHLFSEVENVQVAQPDNNVNDNYDTPEVDKNFWESIRDAFRVREDHEFDDSNKKPENDLLHPYREDLKNGFYIVAVDDLAEHPRSNPSLSENNKGHHTETPQKDNIDPTDSFSEEGSVQGMGDGGQPPVESRSDDGTPPELEDTAASADEKDATDERLRQERRANRPN